MRYGVLLVMLILSMTGFVYASAYSFNLYDTPSIINGSGGNVSSANQSNIWNTTDLGPLSAVSDISTGNLTDDDTYIKADGTNPLTANWDAGNFAITADDLLPNNGASFIGSGPGPWFGAFITNIVATGGTIATGTLSATGIINANGGITSNQGTDLAWGIENQNLVDKSADETITGLWIFDNNLSVEDNLSVDNDLLYGGFLTASGTRPASVSNFFNNFNNFVAMVLRRSADGTGDYLQLQNSSGSALFKIHEDTNLSWTLDDRSSRINPARGGSGGQDFEFWTNNRFEFYTDDNLRFEIGDASAPTNSFIDLDMNGNNITNAFYYGDGGNLSNVNFTELDPEAYNGSLRAFDNNTFNDYINITGVLPVLHFDNTDGDDWNTSVIGNDLVDLSSAGFGNDMSKRIIERPLSLQPSQTALSVSGITPVPLIDYSPQDVQTTGVTVLGSIFSFKPEFNTSDSFNFLMDGFEISPDFDQFDDNVALTNLFRVESTVTNRGNGNLMRSILFFLNPVYTESGTRNNASVISNFFQGIQISPEFKTTGSSNLTTRGNLGISNDFKLTEAAGSFLRFEDYKFHSQNYVKSGTPILLSLIGLDQLNWDNSVEDGIRIGIRSALTSGTNKTFIQQTGDAESELLGNFNWRTDSAGVVFGEADDCSIMYDGNDLRISCSETNVTGNFTGNNLYGAAHFHNDSSSGVPTVIASSGVWYNVSGFNQSTLSSQFLNGFEWDSASETLIAQRDGLYDTFIALSFGNEGNNQEYQVSVAINGVVNESVEFHRKIGAAGDVGSGSDEFPLQILTGDGIKMVVLNVGGTSDINTHKATIKLNRLGDIR